ncbi:unnamed protein product, partial [marine sediment metagenome]
QQIHASSFIPWVTNGDLSAVGYGNLTLNPRKILVLYQQKLSEDIVNTSTFHMVGTPLEYLGYLPRYVNLNVKSPPSYSLKNRYAGIIVWLVRREKLSAPEKLTQFLLKQYQAKIPLLFIENLSLITKDKALTNKLGFQFKKTTTKLSPVSITKQSPLLGFEGKLLPRPHSFTPVRIKNAKVLLQLKRQNEMQDAIAITSWGGYVMAPYLQHTTLDKRISWQINPFKFFKQSLRLPTIPAPDTTK